VGELPHRDLDYRIRSQSAQYRCATAICTCTAWPADSITADYGISPSKVHVVGIGGRQRTASIDRRWSPPRFLFAGREWDRKNGDVLLQAFELVRARRPDAILDVVGDHPPIQQAGVNAHGWLRLGQVEDQRRLDALFAAATCFVLPSQVEPAGQVIIEAATSGIPSIVTSVGGASEIAGPGGVTVDPGQPELLAEQMVLMCDPARAASRGELARRHVKGWTWRRTAEGILTALNIVG
jgi:glycosyltransferase involved in cell wall biosynthesis